MGCTRHPDAETIALETPLDLLRCFPCHRVTGGYANDPQQQSKCPKCGTERQRKTIVGTCAECDATVYGAPG